VTKLKDAAQTGTVSVDCDITLRKNITGTAGGRFEDVDGSPALYIY
jgi:hypothetical protein